MDSTKPSFDHWHHVTISAYGRWLPGDPHGWCERHHRRHVPAVYGEPSPPSLRNERLLEHSKQLLRHDPVTFFPPQRALLSGLLLETLEFLGMQALALSVGGEHCHLLVQIRDPSPKIVVGRIKSWVWKQANLRGFLTAQQRGGDSGRRAHMRNRLKITGICGGQ